MIEAGAIPVRVRDGVVRTRSDEEMILRGGVAGLWLGEVVMEELEATLEAAG